MSLSKLPSEVLSSVLNNRALPLPHRLRLRLLSNRFCEVIEDALKKKSSLVIRDQSSNYFDRKPDHLVIEGDILTDEHIRTLSRHFSGITQLTLSFGNWAESSPFWRTVPSLLAHLTTNLTSVKLYGRIGDENTVAPLVNALNALSSLTSLTLLGFDPGRLLLPHLGLVLSRLKTFACPFVQYDSIAIISSSLSTRCTHLMLHSGDFLAFSGPFLAQLSASLKNLHLVWCDNNVWESLSQMHGLASLYLNFSDYELDASLFSHLGSFPRLTQVKLSGLVYDTPLALPPKKETPLSSIKRLTLEVDFGVSSVDYRAFFRGLSAWYPSLAHLTLITLPDTFPAIRANLDQSAFSVQLADSQTVDLWSPVW